MLKDFAGEYYRYKVFGQKAMDQLSDDALNVVIGPGSNSIAMIVRHISGNLLSRFTDFLTDDGEKSWRNRDAEFEDRKYSREEVQGHWSKGWEVLESQLAALSDDDLQKEVRIRGVALKVHEALARSAAHVAYHVGQIVILARILTDADWRWITIPKNKSEEYNRNPMQEKRP